MNKRILAAAVALAVVVAGGVWLAWAGRHALRRDGQAQGGDEHQVIRLLREPPAIPAFSFTDVNGRSISSASWHGKVVLVNFWATWCPPCRAEIPDLITLQERYRDQLVVVGISEDEGPVDEVKRFVADHGMTYVVEIGTPELRKIFRGVVALPTTFVIDPEGRLQQKHVGLLNARETETETRVLAKLPVNATVERVESLEKARLERAAQAKSLPGVDLSHLSDAQKSEVVKALIAQDCTCGCGLTVAECRIDDPTCPVSLPLAQKIVAQYASGAAAAP
jgi:thiol-disulfide isomerase/thioredoxin